MRKHHHYKTIALAGAALFISLGGASLADGPTGPPVRHEVAATNPVDKQFPKTTVIVTCPTGFHILNGGFGQENVVVDNSVPWGTGNLSGRQWHVSGHLTPGAKYGSLTAIGTCTN